jgi:hypothetical protein
MSFLSIFKTIGVDIEKVVGEGAVVVSGVVTVAEPFVAELNPGAGAILDLVGKATAAAEALITGVQSGQAKQQTAIQIIEAQLPNVQAIISAFGTSFQIPQPQLVTLINASVAQANALEAVISAVKAGTPVPAAAAPAAGTTGI